MSDDEDIGDLIITHNEYMINDAMVIGGGAVSTETALDINQRAGNSDYHVKFLHKDNTKKTHSFMVIEVDGKTLINIDGKGAVTFGEGYNPDLAGVAFWRSVAQTFLAFPLMLEALKQHPTE